MVKVEFAPTKSFSIEEQPPQVGSYALEEANMNWLKCREQFANKFGRDCQGMYFSHERGHENSERVAYFMATVEELLEIEEKSVFAKCTKNFAMWIKPSPFWLDCEMKRSLFTILLRSGLAYDIDKNNFETALFSVNYSNDTRLAVMRFLFGFTKYVADPVGYTTKGWWTAFKDKNEDQVKKQLVSPVPAHESNMVGFGSLWA